MSLSDDEENNNEIYKCALCLKDFKTRSGYWKHTTKSLKGCWTYDKCLQTHQELQIRNTRLKYFENKTTKQKELIEECENEIKRLQNLIGNKIENLETNIKQSLKEEIDTLKDNLDEQFENQGFTTAYNSYIINHHENNNTNFNIKLTSEQKERLDHISRLEFLSILNIKNFNVSVSEYIASVYFNPKAPGNCRWCITDKTSLLGALEYNHGSNTIIRKNTKEVITRNLQNVLYSMSNTLEELKMKAAFNHQQGINYHKFYNMVGETEFNNECINKIKEKAYEGRQFVTALWGHLKIPIETTEIKPRITSLTKII